MKKIVSSLPGTLETDGRCMPVYTYDLLVTWDLLDGQTTKGRKEGAPEARDFKASNAGGK